MSVLDRAEAVAPPPTGAAALIAGLVRAALPPAFAVLRRVWPIPHIGTTYAATRLDDVRDVFANDRAFGVVYDANLQVITGGQPFFLGMADTPEYHAQLAAMRRVFRAADLPALGDRAEALAAAQLPAGPGRIDIVALTRDVTFTLIADYLGIPPTPTGSLAAWATRLFEFQFTGTPKDVALRQDVDVLAPALRAHIDGAITARHAAPDARDDVLGRCLRLQRDGAPGYTDTEIRTALLCMVVGGPPQPPMVVPQAMNQLLLRPAALAQAAAAARAGNDPALFAIVREAMRFDPLAPGLPRVARKGAVLAAGTGRQTSIPEGATVIAAFASGMMDPRRIASPSEFRADRPACDYLHFGHGLHECFGRYINHAILHRMLRPVLARPRLRRAPGPAGQLTRSGIFPYRLDVAFD